jgi:hypothetical protein
MRKKVRVAKSRSYRRILATEGIRRQRPWEMFKLGLQLIYSIFGGAKPHRKLMRQRHGSVALAHLMRSMPAEA